MIICSVAGFCVTICGMNTTEKLDLSALRSAVSALERGVRVVERKETSAEADEMETLRSGVIQCFEIGRAHV